MLGPKPYPKRRIRCKEHGSETTLNTKPLNPKVSGDGGLLGQFSGGT